MTTDNNKDIEKTTAGFFKVLTDYYPVLEGDLEVFAGMFQSALTTYADQRVREERERIVSILNKNMTAKNSYNMTYKELIKAINPTHQDN